MKTKLEAIETKLEKLSRHIENLRVAWGHYPYHEAAAGDAEDACYDLIEMLREQN